MRNTVRTCGSTATATGQPCQNPTTDGRGCHLHRGRAGARPSGGQAIGLPPVSAVQDDASAARTDDAKPKTTTSTRPTWRRAKSTGEWVVFGPAASVQVGNVSVAKRNGKTEPVKIERVGKPFLVDGVEFVYGYPAKTEEATRTGWSSYRSRSKSTGRLCDNCNERVGKYPAVDSSGIPGLVCYQCSYEPSYSLSFC